MKQLICFFRFVLCLTTLFCFFTVGCTRHPFYHQKQNMIIELKKSIGIAQFDNRSKIISDTMLDSFYQQMVTNMRQANPHVYFLTPEGKPEILQKSSLLLSADHIDRQTLIKAAKAKGHQAVIWGIINDISIVSLKIGFPFLKKEKKHVRCRGEFSLFDCETYSKLWYLPINETYSFDSLFDPSLKKYPVLDDQTITKVLAKLSQKISMEMSEQLKKTPWKGFIIQNENNVYVISSGTNTGVNKNMVFDVIGSMGTLPGIYGQKYYIPGKPIGRIQITSTTPDTSTAIPLYGNQLENSIAIFEVRD